MIMGSGASARLTIDASQAIAQVRLLRTELQSLAAVRLNSVNLSHIGRMAIVSQGHVRRLNQELNNTSTVRINNPGLTNLGVQAQATNRGVTSLLTSLGGISRVNVGNPMASLVTNAQAAAAAVGTVAANARTLRNTNIGTPFKSFQRDASNAARSVTGLQTKVNGLSRSKINLNLTKVKSDLKAAESSVDSFSRKLGTIGRTAVRLNMNGVTSALKTAETAVTSLINRIKQIGSTQIKLGTGKSDGDLSRTAENARKLGSELNKVNGKSVSVNMGPADAAIANTTRQVRQLQADLNRMGENYQGASIASGALSAPFVATMAVGLTAAVNLEQAIKNIDVVLGGLNTAELQQLTLDMQTLGINSQYSAIEVAAVAEEIAKAGFEADEITGLTKAVIDLSQATGADLETSVLGITQAMATWNEATVGSELALTDASQAADILTIAANESRASVNDIIMGMRPLGPIASLLGIGFDEAAAAVAMFSNYGMRAADTGVSLARGLQNLNDPTSEAAILMDELGIAVFNAEGKFVGLPTLFQNLSTAFEGMTDKQKLSTISTLFGAEAQDAYALAIQAGADPLKELIALMDQSGIAAQQAGDRVDTAKGALQRMREAAVTLAGTLMQPLLGAVKAIADGISDFFQWVNQLPRPILNAIGALVTLTSAFLALNTMVLLRKTAFFKFTSDMFGITKSTSLARNAMALFRMGALSLIGPLAKVALGLGLVGAAAALFTLAFGSNFLGIRDKIMAVVNAVQDFVRLFQTGFNLAGLAVAGVLDNFKGIDGAIDQYASAITRPFNQATTALEAVQNAAGGVRDALAGAVSPAQSVLDAYNQLANQGTRVSDALGQIEAGLKPLTDLEKKISGLGDATAGILGAADGIAGLASKFESAANSVNFFTKVFFGLGFAFEALGKKLGIGWLEDFGGWLQDTAVKAELLGDFITDLWKGGPRAAMKAYERLPNQLKPFAKFMGGTIQQVKDLGAAWRRGGFPEFAKQFGKSLSGIASDFGDMWREITGMSFGNWVLNVAKPKITGWLGDIAQGAGILLWDLLGWTGAKVIDLAGWVLNIGLPKLGGMITNVWQWVKEQITGREGDNTITLGDVFVSIGKFVWSAFKDLWGWVKRELLGGIGAGSSAAEGAQYAANAARGKTNSLEIGIILVNMAGFAWGTVSSLWDWVKRSLLTTGSTGGNAVPSGMYGGGGGSASQTIDIGNILVSIAGYLKDSWPNIRGWIVEQAKAGASAAGKIAVNIGEIAVRIGGWVKDAWPSIRGWIVEQAKTGATAAGKIAAEIPEVTINIAAWAEGTFPDLGSAIVGWVTFDLPDIDWSGIAGGIVGGIGAALVGAFNLGTSVPNLLIQLEGWLAGLFDSMDGEQIGRAIAKGLEAAILFAVGLPVLAVGSGIALVGGIATGLINADWTGVGTAIKDGMISGITLVKDIFVGFGTTLFNDLLAAINLVDWAGIGSAIKTKFQQIFGGGSGQFTSGDAEQGFVPALEGMDFSSVISDAISGAMETVKGLIPGWATSMWSGFTEGLQGVVDSALGIIEGMINSAIDLINALLEKYNSLPFVNDIQPLGHVSLTGGTDGETNSFLDNVITKTQQMAEEANKYRQAIADAQSAYTNKSGSPDAGGGGGGPGQQDIPGTGPLLNQGGATANPAIAEWADQQQADQSQGVIKDFYSTLQQQGPQRWADFFNTYTPQINNAMRTNMGPQFAQVPQQSLGVLSQAFNTALPGMANTTRTNFTNMAGAATGQSGIMRTGVGASIGGMAGEGIASMLGLQTGATGAAIGMNTGVVGSATGMQQGASGQFSTMAANGGTKAALMALMLQRGATQGQTGVRTGLAPIPGIVTTIGLSAAMAAVSAGAAVSRGFARGIASALGEVRAAVAEMAALARTVIALKLAIQSPSKVFYKLGAFVTLGFAQGITSETSAAVKAVELLVAKTTQAASGNGKKAPWQLAMENGKQVFKMPSGGVPKTVRPPGDTRPKTGEQEIIPPNTPEPGEGGTDTPETPDADAWKKLALKGIKIMDNADLKTSGLKVDTTVGSLFNEKDWEERRKRLGEDKARDVSDLFKGRTRVNDTDFSLLNGRYTEHYGGPVQPVTNGDTTIINPQIPSDEWADTNQKLWSNTQNARAVQLTRQRSVMKYGPSRTL